MPHQTSPVERRNKRLALLFKLLVGAGVLAFIFGQLTLNDQVRLKDGSTKSGRIESVKGSIALPESPHLSVDLFEKPPRILARQDGRWRLEFADGTSAEGSAPVLVGDLVLSTEAESGPRTERIPLADLKFTGEVKGSDWVERTLDFREGLRTIYGRITFYHYVLALLSVALMYLTGIWRWHILLRAQGLDVSFGRAFRLTFIGFFFNNVVPGMTGGDVVKAILIARDHKGRGPDAVSTVIVDRAVGLLMLAFLAGVASIFALKDYGELAVFVFLLLGAGLAVVPIFLSRRIRRRLGMDWLLDRLPGSAVLKRLDQAFLVYRTKPKAIVAVLLLSIAAHVFNVASVAFIGIDLGVGPENGLREPVWLTYAIVVPVTMIVAAVPLLPGGWGVGEAAFGYFFRTVGILNPSLSIGLSVLHRATLLAFSLVGGLFLFARRKDAKAAFSGEAAEDLEETQRDPLATS